jgi:hypothetical protein
MIAPFWPLRALQNLCFVCYVEKQSSNWIF